LQPAEAVFSPVDEFSGFGERRMNFLDLAPHFLADEAVIGMALRHAGFECFVTVSSRGTSLVTHLLHLKIRWASFSNLREIVFHLFVTVRCFAASIMVKSNSSIHS
jgi:hypothetical protein